MSIRSQYLYWIRFYTLIFLVGIVAGLGAIFFRELIGLFHNILFYGQFSVTYDAFQHAAPSPWGIGAILVPVMGAIFVTFLIKNFALEAKGPGVSEVIDAVYYHRGVIRPIVGVIKAIASSISIGSGGSVGREGPIIQIGAAFGSALGQWVKIPEWQRITLMACGAGGGIAATFNTPLGGILFTIEIILPELSARTIIPVSIATAIATYTSYLYAGNVPFISLAVSAVSHISTMDIFSCLLLSVLLGLFSTLFIYAIYATEDIFSRIPGGDYVRHMLGMLLLGIVMYMMMQWFGHYYIQGVGYATVLDVMMSTLLDPRFLLFLAVLKLLATAITLGSGGSGGVFSPLLFIGATLGSGFMGVCHYFFPDVNMNLQLGALIGIGGMVGASTGSFLTAIVMTAELVHDYTLILPLMIIVAIAYAVRRGFIKDSVYTLKLTRRGHVIPDVLTSYKYESN